MRTPHTAYHKGTPVIVRLRDGRVLYDKFKDRKSGYMVLETAGRVPIKSIANTGVYKDRQGVYKEPPIHVTYTSQTSI